MYVVTHKICELLLWSLTFARFCLVNLPHKVGYPFTNYSTRKYDLNAKYNVKNFPGYYENMSLASLLLFCFLASQAISSQDIGCVHCGHSRLPLPVNWVCALWPFASTIASELGVCTVAIRVYHCQWIGCVHCGHSRLPLPVNWVCALWPFASTIASELGVCTVAIRVYHCQWIGCVHCGHSRLPLPVNWVCALWPFASTIASELGVCTVAIRVYHYEFIECVHCSNSRLPLPVNFNSCRNCRMIRNAISHFYFLHIKITPLDSAYYLVWCYLGVIPPRAKPLLVVLWKYHVLSPNLTKGYDRMLN